MKHPGISKLERPIAAARIFLSTVAVISVWVDPTRPVLTRWLLVTGGPFMIDGVTLAIMGAHMLYAVAIYQAVVRRLAPLPLLATVATALDLIFAAAIALVTEGATSPGYVFFAFAILAVGCRSGLRSTLRVTALAVALYLGLILVSAHPTADSYVMRPAYLALTGFLIGYLGQQRLTFEAKIRELRAEAERHRVARSLHDGYAQALAGVNLRLETCRELLRRGRHNDAFTELTDLQAGVGHEYDQLRAYIRSLVEVDETATRPRAPAPEVRVSIDAAFGGPGALAEHILAIMLEGVRNARRHAEARMVIVTASPAGASITVTIDDDGVGFHGGAELPWSMVSRVTEFGGRIARAEDGRPGAHVVVEVPIA